MSTVVGSTPGGSLDRLAVAATVAAELAAQGDELVDHFVTLARADGCSWAQIGERLGVTRQAAQQRFVAPLPVRRRSAMFQRFDDESRAVVTHAEEAAHRLRHNYVGTEHLLLGLLANPEGAAAEVLIRLGVTSAAVVVQVQEIIGRGTTVPEGVLCFTPRAKRVLQIAVDEAKAMGDDHVTTGHVLLALLREGEGLAVHVLTRLGLTLPAVCQQLSTVFGRPVNVEAPRQRRRRRR